MPSQASEPTFTDPFSQPTTPVIGFNNASSAPPDDTRRGSDDSDKTLYDADALYDKSNGVLTKRRESGVKPPQPAGSSAFFSIEPDDPRLQFPVEQLIKDIDEEFMKEDKELHRLNKMTGRQRMKESLKLKIVKHITSHIHRQRFLMKLAKALLKFGCPTHAAMALLHDAANILKVQVSFVTLPNTIIASFGNCEEMTSEIEMLSGGGGLDLGRLPMVRVVYYNVVHDIISAKDAIDCLDQLMDGKPIHGKLTKCFFAFMLSALICVMSFGGSFVDMWIAGLGSATFSAVRLFVIPKVHMGYASAYEISMTIAISFVSRGLSSIRSEVFCYNAISSAGIVSILPGFLILTSSLELASKNILCGAAKMIYVLVFVLFITFGLQLGSDLYLLLDLGARHKFAEVAATYLNPVLYVGSFVSDSMKPDGTPVYVGTFQFQSPATQPKDMLVGCHRPADFPWYKQPFAWWSLFFLVPLYTLLSSMANMQPVFKRVRQQKRYAGADGKWQTTTVERWTLSADLVVMVMIAILSYTCNKIAKMYIFNQSDVVAAIGAFTVGVMGNTYQRLAGGTAFTYMVTGVCFLVPSSFSQTGDNFSGDIIDIGTAMIRISVGISVGLLMARFIVCTFGKQMRSGSLTF